MPTCKYCQEHVGFLEGGMWLRIHPACSMDLSGLDQLDRELFWALPPDTRAAYRTLPPEERRAILANERSIREAEQAEQAAREHAEAEAREAEKARRAAQDRAEAEIGSLGADVALTGTYDSGALRLQIASIAVPVGMTAKDVEEILRAGWSISLMEARMNGQISNAEVGERAEQDEAFLEAVRLTDDDLASEDLIERLTARLSLRSTVMEAATSEDDEALVALDELFQESGLGETDQQELAVEVWHMVVPTLIEDGLLTTADDEALERYLEYFELPQEDLERGGTARLYLHASTLRRSIDDDFLDLPDAAAKLGHRIPFNLLKSETLVWLVQNAHYSTIDTMREFRGSSHGLSIRIASGLYYRPSAFSGRSVTSEKTTHVDTGMLGITTKHLYFHGPSKRFRVRYDKIVSFEPYSDGLGFMRDNLRAKPETFTVGENDGWFLYNLVTNLAQR